MANIVGLYNPEAEAQQDFSPLPTGEYLAQIVESEIKPTKKNDGHYLELKLQVLDGPYKGRNVWDRLNLDNPNPKAVDIANRALSSIREVTGVLKPNDSQELHYKPMVIRVETYAAGTAGRNGQVRDRDECEIKAYKKAEAGNAPAASAASPAPTTAPSSAVAPWKRVA